VLEDAGDAPAAGTAESPLDARDEPDRHLGSALPSMPSQRCGIAADTSLSLPHLDAIHLLGISREDVEAAAAEDPALPDDGRILRLAEDQPSAD